MRTELNNQIMIFKKSELEKNPVVRNFRIVQIKETK